PHSIPVSPHPPPSPFFFPSPPPLLALPSFPTRRSSDLAGDGHGGLCLLFTLFLDLFTLFLDLFTLFLDLFTLFLDLFTLFLDLLDRKSTRLNSSHRTISYAVFCLKKKIILYIIMILFLC